MADQLFYKFLKLDLAQFATFESNDFDVENLLDFATTFRFAYNRDSKAVCCTTSVIISQKANVILKADLNSMFEILSESVQALTDDGYFTLSTSLLTQFASLGYGSMRGVIYAKTIGTPFDKIILPPNDLQQIFTSPLKFKL